MVDSDDFPKHSTQQDDEIDLKELFLVIWQGKWIIILVSFVFAVGGVLYALSKPNIYKAEAVLASATDGSSGGLASQLGGLASLAGISIGGNRPDGSALALATLQSHQFINTFIVKHNLLVPLMAGIKWDSVQDKLLLSSDIYDQKTQEWKREVGSGRSFQPTAWKACQAFNKIITVSKNKENGFVTLAITHLSPTIAKQWVDWLILDLNSWMKEKSLEETRNNIRYLKEQVQRTNIADMQSVFYQLIEEQMKNLMLAEAQDEFAFKVIDPAVVPEEKAGPKRALICLLAVLVGGMLGMAIVLVRFTFGKTKQA